MTPYFPTRKRHDRRVGVIRGASDLELLSDDIKFFAEKTQTSVSLRTLTETGRGDRLDYAPAPDAPPQQRMLFQVAMFLHRELPIRLAHRVRDLDAIPHLGSFKTTRDVRQMYATSFEEIRAAPAPNTLERERYFADLIGKVYSRHSSVLLMMARSAYQLRQKIDESSSGHGPGVDFAEQAEIHSFLNSFYMSRIGIRMLIGQYLALREEQIGSGYVGLVQQHTSPAEVALAAVEDAKFMCNRSYGDAPEVTMHGRTDLTFQYVPTHMHYILLELLKNSMRATIEYHGTDEMPPIRVVIADGELNEDVVIKVSDEGGGVSRSHMKKVWSYLFTTADPNVQAGAIGDDADRSDFDTSSPLAGLGYGLPISRAYARYFGGDLSIMSMEGYGTDAFVHLSRLGTHDEPLP